MNRSLSCAAVLLLVGCATKPPVGTSGDVVVTSVDTIVAAGDSRFAGLSEVTVGPEGSLFVVDSKAGKIFGLGSDGAVTQTIGGAGAGPGELQQPQQVHVGPDTIRVIDYGNGRLSRFTRDGKDAGTTPLTPAFFGGTVSFGDDGSAIVSNVSGKFLASRFDPAGTIVDSFASQVVPAPAGWDFPAIKKTIAAGQVPANMRNLVLPVLAPDGTAWLAYHTEGVVEHYDQRDSLVARAELEIPELAAIREEFFRRNKTLPGNQLFPLSEFVHGEAIGSGLWLLVREPEDSASLILVLGPDARLEQRIRTPTVAGARGFAVNLPDHRLYLLSYGDGAVYAATLPATLFDSTSVD